MGDDWCAQFQRIVEQQTECICRIAPDGTLLYLNPACAKAFRSCTSDVSRTSFLDWIDAEMRLTVRAELQGLTPERDTLVLKHEVTSPSGAHRWHQWRVRATFDAQGEITEYLAVGHNISPRRMAEDELQRKKEELDELFARRTAEFRAANYQLQREIVERRKVAEALRDSEERLRQIIKLIPHLVFVKDGEGRFLVANDAIASLYGLNATDLVGKIHRELHVHTPEEAVRFLADDHEVIDSGEAKFIPREPLTDAGGRLHWLQVTKIPYTVYGTGERAVLGVGVDISDQERTLATLKRRDAILEAISFSAERFLAEGDWRKNIDEALEALGRAAEVSRVYIFENGRHADGRLTMTQIHEWTAPTVSAEIDNPAMQHLTYEEMGFQRWEQILGSGKIIYGNIQDFPASEREVLVAQNVKSIAAVPVVLADKFWGFIGVDECMEERVWSAAELDALKIAASTFAAALQRKRAEEERLVLEAQIQQTQKLESLGVLAGGVAHDFNNLLMAILGNANLALLDLEPDSTSRHSIERIELAAQRAAELTRQMLAYSGKGKFIIESVRLTDLVQEMLGLLTVSMPKKLDLILDLEESLPLIEGDVTQLRQVVMNLITNAAEAMADLPGSLKISTRQVYLRNADLTGHLLADDLPEGPYVELVVEDSGCGMDADTLQRIFDPFFTTKFAGRGLGLAAVLGIVRSHRGGLEVTSTPHIGTTFKVFFPAIPGAVEVSGVPQSMADWTGAGVALIVDDEAQVRDVASQMAARAGYEVDVAIDGVEALDRVNQNPNRYAFILLDLNMPRMGGEETLQHIRRTQPQVPVLLSSGYDEGEISDLISGDPNTRFIQKPYRRHEFLERLEDLLRPPKR
jgi:PAS domain S-box-containing protein